MTNDDTGIHMTARHAASESSGVFVIGGAVAVGASAAAAQTAGGADVHEGRRANLPGEVRGVPPARFDRADVARHLRRGAAVGALDPRARRRSPDAALEHRQERRRAELQERSLARRQADRDDPEVGRRRRAAGQPERHACAARPGPRIKAGTSRPCSDRKSRT